MRLRLAKYAWFDGRYVTAKNARVPITTHAIHYGTSVFEGIRAYWDGKELYVFRLDDHVKRFRRSGRFYNMALRFSDRQVADAITGTCRKNALRRSCYIRPFYFVGEYGINLHVTERAPTSVAVFAFPFGDLFSKDGISVAVSSWRKFSDASTPPQAKMGGNYLNSIIATQEAKRNGADEAILLDHSGNVSEAPGENVFIVKDGRLATPPLSSLALDGITRDTVARIAGDLDIEVRERQIARSELATADEVFLTGTAAEITPVTSVDSKKVGDGRPGDITRMMIDRYADIVTNRESGYEHWLTAVYR